MISPVLPVVSIVIPVYNGSNFLAEAIECSLNQTYPSIEVVVVNDGSTDGGKTREIALKYGDKISYYEKENGGVSSALNLGLERIQGAYFSWLSHDDILAPEYVSSQMTCIKASNKNASICKVGVIDDDSNITSTYNNWNVPFFITDKPYVSNMIWVYACCIVVSKDFFIKAGVFSEKLRTCQDIIYTYNVLHYADCAFNQEMHGFRREHLTNDSKKDHIISLNQKELDLMFIDIYQTKSIWFFFTKEDEHLSKLRKLFYLLTLSSSFKTFDQIDVIYKLTRWNKTLLRWCYNFSTRFIYLLRIRNFIIRFFK